MTSVETKAAKKRATKIGAIVGMVLALACQAVPPDYQAACAVVAQIVPGSCS
jgi:hypothetical protein